MSLQAVIDRASSIEISRRKLGGQTISRSGRVKTSSVASVVPFQFKVQMAPGLRYSTNRELVEEIDRLGRIFTETIDIGNSNPGLAYITEYLGQLSTVQLDQIVVSSADALAIELNVGPVTGTNPATILFRKGDFIQLDTGYKYPYTVTSDVLRGVESTVTVPINRPFIEQPDYTVSNKGILVGTDVTFHVVMTMKPDFRIVPHDLLEFTSGFELIEVIE